MDKLATYSPSQIWLILSSQREAKTGILILDMTERQSSDITDLVFAVLSLGALREYPLLITQQ